MEKICANLIASCTKKINRKFKYKTKLVNNYHQRMTAMADAPTYRHMVHLDCCEKNLFLKYTCVYLYIKKMSKLQWVSSSTQERMWKQDCERLGVRVWIVPLSPIWFDENIQLDKHVVQFISRLHQTFLPTTVGLC